MIEFITGAWVAAVVVVTVLKVPRAWSLPKAKKNVSEID